MKSLFALVCAAMLSMGAWAGNYHVNENQMDALFAQAEDVTMEETVAFEDMIASGINMNMATNETTRGGFLLRAFFCGGFALHRYYMGSTGAKFFFLYACVPVVGYVAVLVDFWSVVIDESKLSNYKGNQKYLVWTD